MSAVILAFPGSAVRQGGAPFGGEFLWASSPPQAVDQAREGAEFLVIGQHLPTTFTPAWCAQHLPLIDAAMELLEADDAELSQRCCLMRDEEGRAMLDELAGQLQRLGAHIANVADALGLTAERIRGEMTPRT